MIRYAAKSLEEAARPASAAASAESGLGLVTGTSGNESDGDEWASDIDEEEDEQAEI